MQTRRLGPTDLEVTRLGAGLFELSTLDSDAEAAAVLPAALDGGVTFLDTAACYGAASRPCRPATTWSSSAPAPVVSCRRRGKPVRA